METLNEKQAMPCDIQRYMANVLSCVHSPADVLERVATSRARIALILSPAGESRGVSPTERKGLLLNLMLARYASKRTTIYIYKCLIPSMIFAKR